MILVLVFLFAVYATKVVLQIMAEGNKETKIPQGQNGHRSAAIHQRMNQKTEWPEAVGLTAEEAERIIKEEKPGVQIQVLPPKSGCTQDYRPQRVRLHVDFSGKVHKPPTIG
ncbi:hypothetical protein RHSIM_Rhsim05G0195200 [Rhododendron simsii]|uniref:Uncharacterized protein n=1 Tax=Rhododendron simsii TaxID=118357 RepID=A0A834GVG0_RHOSS|nr:hypothetical protein RHSIM_Rhsim05G0195200 [Rhododendron simsii]